MPVVPTSLSSQLYKTLQLTQPIETDLTVQKLFELVSTQVVDFLKIPMTEVTEAGFYKMYDSANKPQLQQPWEPPEDDVQSADSFESKVSINLKRQAPITNVQKQMSMFDFND